MSKKKKDINIEKMDVISRRKFIRNLGFFLGTLSVSSLVRLETMEKISRKVLGSSLAFADEMDDVLNYVMYIRGGAPLANLVGRLTDDAVAQHPDLNLQYSAAQITNYTDTGGNPLNLPDGSAPLADYRQMIQFCNTFSNYGHRQAFGSAAHDAGANGNQLIMAAEQYGAPTLTNSLAFYNGPSDDDMDALPSSKSAYHPEFHASIDSLLNKFSQLEVSTAQGNALSEEQRNSLYTIIQNKFDKDVEKALRTAEAEDIMKGSQDKALNALKVDYSTVMNIDNDTSGVAATLTAGLGGQPFGGITPVEAFYSFARAAENGVTNNVALISNSTGDWHGNNDRQGENPAARQITVMTYVAQTIRNIMDAAGTFINPNTGNAYSHRVLVTSEFTRNNKINIDDNPDGGKNGAVLVASDPTAFGSFNAGSFGGLSEAGADMYSTDANGNLTANGSNWSQNSLFMHVSRFMGLDTQAAGLIADDDDAEVKNILGGA